MIGGGGVDADSGDWRGGGGGEEGGGDSITFLIYQMSGY
jgi:hypothetical protein